MQPSSFLAQLPVPRLLPVLVLAVATVALPAHAGNRRSQGPKPACGIDFLPFTEGVTWTYELSAPDEESAKKALTAKQPESITIRVLSVSSHGKDATIELEESYRKVKVHTTIECSRDRMIVDPASFLWAGEPGGGLQMTLSGIDRHGASYPGAKGLTPGLSLHEDWKAKVERKAAEGSKAVLASGRVEMERELQVGKQEEVSLTSGPVKAYRVEIALSGRGRLDGDKQAEREMAAGAKAVLWFASDVGLVRIINRHNQAWLLTAK